jgi:hypothetical protein
MKLEPLTEDELLAHIGVLLMNVQQFEFLLLFALKLIYADQAELNAGKIFSEDKRTLGRLLKDLRKKTKIEASADELLEELLKERNMFVHHLIQQEWFDTSTESSRDRVMNNLAPFTERLSHAIRLFVAIHIEHGDSIGFESSDTKKIKEDDGWKLKHYLA